jgi:hypothetical protein
MLRRFSTNFALLSIFLDGLSVLLGLWLSSLLRPWMNQFNMFEKVAEGQVTPAALYIIFPVMWLLVFISFSIYDGTKFLRVVDELAAHSGAVFIAAISSAGILYLLRVPVKSHTLTGVCRTVRRGEKLVKGIVH